MPDLPFNEVAMVTIAAEASSAFDDFVAEGGPADLRAEADRLTPYSRDAISARDYLRSQRVRAKMSKEMDMLCARFDALVVPAVNNPSPRVDETFQRGSFAGGVPLGAAGNLVGLPAATLPNGRDANGLPTSLQLVGRAFEENRVLAIATELQRRTDWHQQLPPIVSGQEQ
jgi:Asp-tRNA(Asn)/Glu-tRNA(Gln) amidotransferase A subunit family amidase